MHGWISKTTNLCSEKLLFGWSIKHMSGLKKKLKGYQKFSFYPLTMTIILIRLGKIQWWKYGTQRGRKPFKNDRGLQNRQFPFFPFSRKCRAHSFAYILERKSGLKIYKCECLLCSCVRWHYTQTVGQHYTWLHTSAQFNQHLLSWNLQHERVIWTVKCLFSSRALRIIYLFSWSWHQKTMVCMTFGCKTLKYSC